MYQLCRLKLSVSLYKLFSITIPGSRCYGSTQGIDTQDSIRWIRTASIDILMLKQNSQQFLNFHLNITCIFIRGANWQILSIDSGNGLTTNRRDYVCTNGKYHGVPGFATDCPCVLWCRGLTTCLLYVGPLFGNLVENDSRFVSLT